MPDENDLNALPNADLTPILDDLKKNVDEPKPQPAPKTPDDLDLGQFKNPKDLLKSYKEVQAAFTKVTQENKSYKEQMAKIQEEMELARLNAQQIPVQQPQFHDAYNEQASLAKEYNLMRIAEILEEENEKNPSEFQERYAYAQMVSRQYPNLSVTPRGVKKLFEMGDKLKVENLKKGTSKALESIFGEPLGEEAITKLRTLVKGESQKQPQSNMNAYMPDTSTSTRSGADQNQKPTLDRQIGESAEKGDVDGVIKSVFKKALAE